MKTEQIETITTEGFVEIKETKNGKPMFTISRDLVVVETTKTWANPSSYDYDMMELFLKNNRETLESYFSDNEKNYGITFYECGYNGAAQDEFIQGWAENGVRVF